MKGGANEAWENNITAICMNNSMKFIPKSYCLSYDDDNNNQNDILILFQLERRTKKIWLRNVLNKNNS